MSEYNYGPLEHELAGGEFGDDDEQPRPEQAGGGAAESKRDYYAEFQQQRTAKYPAKVLVDLVAAGEINREQYERLRRETVEHDAPAAPERGEQSRLFPRYSFAVVTGRYKILDNRADGTPKFPQIATADGEDEARLIVGALNAAEQHSTLVAQRERLLDVLRRARAAAQIRSDLNERLHGRPTKESWVADADAVLTTVEQEGDTLAR